MGRCRAVCDRRQDSKVTLAQSRKTAEQAKVGGRANPNPPRGET